MVKAHLFLDQVEGELAVLTEVGGEKQEYIVPLTDLPVGVQEGAWLTVEIPMAYTISSYYAAVQEGREQKPNFVLDEETGEAVKQQVQSLMDELSG